MLKVPSSWNSCWTCVAAFTSALLILSFLFHIFISLSLNILFLVISSVLVSICTSHAFEAYHLEFFLTYSSVLFQWLHFFLRISTCFSLFFFVPSLSSFIIVYLFESGRGRERQKPSLKTRLEITVSKHAKANTYMHSYILINKQNSIFGRKTNPQ